MLTSDLFYYVQRIRTMLNACDSN